MHPAQQKRPGESLDSRAKTKVELKRLELSTSALRTHNSRCKLPQKTRVFRVKTPMYPLAFSLQCSAIDSFLTANSAITLQSNSRRRAARELLEPPGEDDRCQLPSVVETDASWPQRFDASVDATSASQVAN
jgi:hypothetical protein